MPDMLHRESAYLSPRRFACTARFPSPRPLQKADCADGTAVRCVTKADAPVMGGDNFLYDGQSQSVPAGRRRPLFAQRKKLIGGKADPVIENGQRQLSSRGLEPHRNATPVGIVPDAVADQVFQHAGKQRAVAEYLHAVCGGWNIRLYGIAPKRIVIQKGDHGFSRHGGHREPLRLQRLHRMLEPVGQIQVLDEGAKLLAFYPNQRRLFPLRLRQLRVIFQTARIAQYGGKRRSHVVGHRRNPLRARFVALFVRTACDGNRKNENQQKIAQQGDNGPNGPEQHRGQGCFNRILLAG